MGAARHQRVPATTARRTPTRWWARSPPGSSYPHASDARIGTGPRRRRRRGDQATDRGKPPARGVRGGDRRGRAGLPGQGDRNRPGRDHPRRDDAADGRLGDGDPAAPVTGHRPHQGGADHRPRPGGRQDPRRPGRRRRLPDQALRPRRDDPRGPRAGRERPAVITAELRRAILAVAGPDQDPQLRPGAEPGSYTSSLPFRLAPGPRQALTARLASEPWIAAAGITSPGYLTVTVTHEALAGLAVRVARAGPACAASDALRGRTVPGPASANLMAAPDWPSARAALAAEVTARLAAT